MQEASRAGHWYLAWLESLIRCSDYAASRRLDEEKARRVPRALGLSPRDVEIAEVVQAAFNLQSNNGATGWSWIGPADPPLGQHLVRFNIQCSGIRCGGPNAAS